VAVLRVCTIQKDAVLRQKAKRVTSIDRSIQQLIDNMIETMRQANGVGLAAPQVGISLRIIVLQMPGEEPLAIINPEITECSGEQVFTEGCLSVPGYCGQISRSARVTVKGLGRTGNKIKIKADGLMAEALQHEIDHLNGIVYIDHIADEGKLYQVGDMDVSKAKTAE